MTKRLQFLNFLIKESSGLNYVFPTYIYNEIAQLPPSEPLEVLIDSEDWSSFMYIISNGKAIQSLKTSRTLYAQKIKITFSDYTSLILLVKTKIERNGIVLMKTNEVLQSAIQLPDAIKIPAPRHQFEYILFKSLLIKRNMDEKYSAYFLKFNPKHRTEIFGHLIPKYKFVINVIDDLFCYDKKFYRKMKYALALKKENRSYRFIFHEAFFVASLITIGLINSVNWIASKFRFSSKPLPENLKALLPKKV